MKKFYVFDMDGTITDSMCQFSQGVAQVLSGLNINCSDKIIREVTPLGLVKTAEYFIDKLGVTESVESLVNILEKTLCQTYQSVRLKPFAKEYLEKIYNQGGRLYILTANHPSIARVTLKNNGIESLFEGVLSVFDFGATKSEVKLYELLVEKLGCNKEDLVYFDDSPIAVSTAMRAGLDTFGIEDRQSQEDKQLIEKLCTKYVRSYTEIL